MEQMKALETRGKARAAKETAKRSTQGGGSSSGGSSQGQGQGPSGKKSVVGDDESSEPKQVSITVCHYYHCHCHYRSSPFTLLPPLYRPSQSHICILLVYKHSVTLYLSCPRPL